MLISVTDPIWQTYLFAAVFFLILIISIKPRKIGEWVSLNLSTELKGLAIIMVVLSHIGYFLVSDTRFLWPLSIAAGIGVDLFLLLSGFGLAASQLKNYLKPLDFYKKRLIKLFVPLWLVLVVFFGLNFISIKTDYSWMYVIQSFLGIFPKANLYWDINSPLWYLTFLLGYYLIFPLVYSKKAPWAPALILAFIPYLLIYFWKPEFFNNILHMYKIHYLAFPLGVLLAWLVTKLPSAEILEKWSKGWKAISYYLVLIIALAIFIYSNINSGIDGTPLKHQLMSLVGVFSILIVFILKKIEFKALYWVGVFSYEIYLWHWPIMYHYDFLYRFMPSGIATILYLIFFVGLGWVVNKVTDLILNKKRALVCPVPDNRLTKK
ncbi:MAG: acyltransferase family protein [Patescibacteria group bacterium]